MRFVFLLFLCTVTSGTIFSQHIKYKDLFPTFSGLSNEEVKNELWEYIIEDLDHPNANFRLACIYESNYKAADPLIQYEYAIANAEQAKVRFLKSKQIIDDREVDRNNDQYFPVFKTYDSKGKPYVDFAQVLKKMNNGYDSASIFLSRIPVIYKMFTRSVMHYDKAAKEFATISIEYLNTEDLLLLYNDTLNARLNNLKLNYDSAIYYLDEYAKLIKEYPIRYHNQKYTIKPISTFRLDGLQSRINFLTNNIQLWNYGAWVEETQKREKLETVNLRTGIQQQEEKLNQSLSKVRNITPEEVYKPIVLDKSLMFALSNSDPNSIVQSLFHYREYKQEFIRMRKQLRIDSTSDEKNAQLYTQFLYSNLRADTLLGQINLSISDLKLSKHKEFIQNHYKGADGIRTLIKDEEQVLKDDYQLQTNSIIESVRKLDGSVMGDSTKQVKIGTLNVPLFIMTNDSLPMDNVLHTHQLARGSDGSIYAGGVYRPDKKLNNLVTYVARVSNDGKSDWIKSFNLKTDSLGKEPADNFMGPLVVTREGCAFVVRTINGLQNVKINTLVYLTEKGEEKNRIKLNEVLYPRFIVYNETLNGFAIALKGEAQKENFANKENLTLLSYNVLGDLLWKRELPVTGNVTKLINLNEGYGIIGNYSWILDQNNKEFRTRANQNEVSPYFAKIKTNGEIVLIKPYNFNTSLVAGGAVKVNDNSIHIRAQKITLDQYRPKGDLKSHIMINSSGSVIFQTLN